ncbi:MAG: CDP-alcohol phosphatidyltransferase family protein [Acutalibacteraceae bacterium]|nr:CDP-alcohol phosphatidyltransferase family protein [Acutalibacteraceae bacterium]
MTKAFEGKIITIPNILSAFRIVLVPVFAIIYFADSIANHYYIAAGVLVLSGLTDILDGTIARHFNMISSFGKVLDPLADKLTQGVAVICLSVRHPLIIPLLILLCAKELTMLLCSVRLIKMGLRPSEAKWWGKMSTVAIFIFMVAVLLSDIFPSIPMPVIIAIEVITAICMLFSLFNYYPIFREIQSGEYDISAEKRTKSGDTQNERKQNN